MLFELMQEFKKDVDKKFGQVDKKFEQADKRFEQMEIQRQADKADTDKKFERLEQKMDKQFAELRSEFKEEIKEMKYYLRTDREKLDKVYDSRNHLKVRFSWSFAGVNAFIAMLTALVVSFVANNP